MFQELGAPVCRVMSPCFLYSRGAPKSCSDPLFVGLQTQIAKDVFPISFPPVSCWQWGWDSLQGVVQWGRDESHRAGLSPDLASSRTAEFKSQGHWKAQPTPSPVLRAPRVGTCKCQAGEGVGQALQRGQSLCHHLHTAQPQPVATLGSLLGTPSHLLQMPPIVGRGSQLDRTQQRGWTEQSTEPHLHLRHGSPAEGVDITGPCVILGAVKAVSEFPGL